MVVALTRRHWADLLSATGLTEVVQALGKSLGADFTTEDDRFEYREVLAGLLARWFSRTDLAVVKATLRDTALLWSTYNTFAELVSDSHAMIAENPMMHLIDQPGVGPHLAPGIPLAFAGADRTPARAPILGEHTAELLARIGLSPDDIEDLDRRRIVGRTSP